MKKFFNLRPLFVSAVSLVFGILTFFLFAFYEIPGIILLFTGAAALIISPALYFWLSKSPLKRKGLAAALFGTLLIFFFGGFFISYAFAENWGGESRQTARVSGTVSEHIDYSKDASVSFILRDVSVSGLGKGGKMLVHMELTDYGDFNYLTCGKRVEFTADVSGVRLIAENKVNIWYFKNDLRYVVRTSESAAAGTVRSGSPNFMEGLRLRVKEVIYKEMGSEIGSAAYGMLTGDSADIPETLIDSLRLTGISHILSVSGLHISFLCVLLSAGLNRIKMKRAYSFAIFTVFISFYCAFAGFAASAVRAAIMAIMANAAGALGKKSDPLSNLSLAAIVLLLVSPAMLFDPGFRMSFLISLAIIGLRRPLLKGFSRIRLIKKLPKFALQSLAISTAAQVGLVPDSLFTFRGIYIYSILANALLMPLLSAAFIFTFLTAFLAAALPFLSFTLKLAYWLMLLINLAANLVAALPFAFLLVYSAGAVFLFVPQILLMSEYTIVKTRARVILTAVNLVLLMALVIPYNFMPVYAKGEAEVLSVNVGAACLVSAEDGTLVLVGDFRDYYCLESSLSALRVRRVNAIVLTRYTDESLKNARKAADRFNADTVYMLSTAPAEAVVPGKSDYLAPLLPKSCGGVRVTAYIYGGRAAAVGISDGSGGGASGPVVLLLSASATLLESLAADVPRASLVISGSFIESGIDAAESFCYYDGEERAQDYFFTYKLRNAII